MTVAESAPVPRWRRTLDHVRSTRRRPESNEQLPWRVPVLALVVLVILAGGALWLTLDWLERVATVQADQSKAIYGKDYVTATLDAVKIALSVVAGGGALFALYLGVRRQRTSDRDLRARLDAQAHTEHDAKARRVTELYTKAADQLGSDKAAVRLAGLYALERLGQDNLDQRPTIANLWCAYLRMPYTPPSSTAPHSPSGVTRPLLRTPRRRIGIRRSDSSAAAPPGPKATRAAAVQERDVRLSVQRLLAKHLRPHRDSSGQYHHDYWPEIFELDLTEAILIDVDLSLCRLPAVRMDRTAFIGDARFDGVTFTDETLFASATFAGGAEFAAATFDDGATFDGATFTGRAAFSGATFDSGTEFAEAIFAGDALFSSATFTADATFDGATFTSEADFFGATFNGDAMFGAVAFDNEVRFGSVTFEGGAVFRGATFSWGGWFANATFTGSAVFVNSTFDSDAVFGGATFADTASFDGANLAADTAFNGTTFAGDAAFNSTTFAKDATFEEATFSRETSFVRAIFAGDVTFDGATFADTAAFGGVTFDSEATFNDAAFGGYTEFGHAVFSSMPTFRQARVRPVDPDQESAWPEGWILIATDPQVDGDDWWRQLVPVPAVVSPTMTF
ncbi:pentapeptide repeat-containing protein [Lentzea sp. E54]|uniref:pentapeptide repeat-containing protein n=1 Tax=Lentzea xerophila TaxID=3435883 RepID=UPI003DA63C53